MDLLQDNEFHQQGLEASNRFLGKGTEAENSDDMSVQEISSILEELELEVEPIAQKPKEVEPVVQKPKKRKPIAQKPKKIRMKTITDYFKR